MLLILVSLCGLITCVSQHKHLLVHLSCQSITKTKQGPFTGPGWSSRVKCLNLKKSLFTPPLGYNIVWSRSFHSRTSLGTGNTLYPYKKGKVTQPSISYHLNWPHTWGWSRLLNQNFFQCAPATGGNVLSCWEVVLKKLVYSKKKNLSGDGLR